MCIAEWNKKLPSGPLIDKEKKKLLRLDPLSECFLNVNLGINNIKVFSHGKKKICAGFIANLISSYPNSKRRN